MANSISDNQSRQGDPLPAGQKTSSDGTDDIIQLNYDPQSTPEKWEEDRKAREAGQEDLLKKRQREAYLEKLRRKLEAFRVQDAQLREQRLKEKMRETDEQKQKALETFDRLARHEDLTLKSIVHTESKVRPKPHTVKSVFLPPTVDVPLGFTEFAYKEKDATLFCKFNNGFDATSKWYKDGQEVLAWEAEQTFDGRTAKLVFREATKWICGVYECIVKNTGGEAKTRGLVSLRGVAAVGHLLRLLRFRDMYMDIMMDPSFVRTHFMKTEKSSRQDQCLLEFIKSVMENVLKDVKSLMIGYALSDKIIPIIVATVDEHRTDFPTEVMGFSVIQRVNGQVSDEARVVARKEQVQNLSFSTEEQTAIYQCLAKYSVSLMKKHSNLMIVSASKIKSVRHGKENASYMPITCIVLYVDIKGVIPLSEEEFPTRLGDFLVDVREGGFKQYTKNPSDYHERLIMGCQIVTDYKTSGTLGGFVQLNGNIACLTCCHVFETEESTADFHKDIANNTFVRRDVYQPYQAPGYKIGILSNFIKYEGDADNIGVDAALIELTSSHRLPQSGCFPNAVSEATGFSSENPMVYKTGEVVKSLEEISLPCTVVKYGAGTGHTIGMLRLAGPAVRLCTTSFHPEDKVRLYQQFEVFQINDQPFADEGDSGSLVFAISGLNRNAEIRALGLLVGGTDHGTTIVTPIWAVLKMFKLPLKLLAFESEEEHGSQIPQSEQGHDRLEGIKRDVDDLKNNLSTLAVNVDQMDKKIDSRFTDLFTFLKEQKDN